MKRIDPLEYLRREDKWYLGGGNRLIWTPTFPVWLDKPGFWDKAHYYNIEFEPLFTWTLLDETGNEVILHQKSRNWNPSRLESEFEPVSTENRKAFTIIEQKCCQPEDSLTSTVEIRNTSNRQRKLHFILWTIQPNYLSKKSTWIENLSVDKSAIHFMKYVQQDKKPLQSFACVLGIKGGMKSYTVNLSEGNVIQPRWRLTPFAEKFRSSKFGNEIKLTGVDNDGLIYIGIHTTVILPPKKTKTVPAIFSAGPTENDASRSFTRISKVRDLPEASSDSWKEYFSTVPHFECSDEYITRYYWYRWYGLRLLTLKGGEGNYRYPAVCEGIGYFRAPITYSAMCHMLENRWLDNPELAQGSLLTFIDNQREDGGYRGYIDLKYFRQEMFYHANWGNSLLQLHRHHPDMEFLNSVYDGLVKYVEYFDRERDAEGSGLYDIDNHYETGQEFMHRYIAVDPNADKDNWGEVFRLKGVDVTVYIYELKKALAEVSSLVKKPENELARWKTGAEFIRKAILGKMWDSTEEMFFDVDPKTGNRTGVKAALCFYPYMTDIAGKEHIPGLKKHLLNANEFWTLYPVPSSSVDDPYYSADAEWKGKRMNCPWNGRVWPMTNSHIAEALAHSAIAFQDSSLKNRSVEFMNKFIRMMFFDGDPARPNCFEHYNPVTGKASEYRGVDDYQHSWVNDLILKYVAGIRAEGNGIFIEPFPFNLDYVFADNIKIKGNILSVEQKKSAVNVRLNGKVVIRFTKGECVFLKK